jgi:hypothetical protein
MAVPGATSAAGSPPTEPCVPGITWEDPASGITYICIYDELYGGSRWDVLPKPDQGKTESTTYRSSVNGCVLGTVAISSISGGGGNSLVRSYRWPCLQATDRLLQPPGEIRIRTIIQRYASSTWTSCRDTGYQYNTATAWTLVGGVDMGAAPDCGAGVYRTWGFGQVYQGSTWRGTGLYSPSLWID